MPAGRDPLVPPVVKRGFVQAPGGGSEEILSSPFPEVRGGDQQANNSREQLCRVQEAEEAPPPKQGQLWKGKPHSNDPLYPAVPGPEHGAQVESSQEAETPGCATGAVLGCNSSLLQVPHHKLRNVPQVSTDSTDPTDLVAQISSGSCRPCPFTRCSVSPQPFSVQSQHPQTPGLTCRRHSKKLLLFQVLYIICVWE